MTIKDILLLFFLYIVLVIVPEDIFYRYINRLRERGVIVYDAFSIFQFGQSFVVPKNKLELVIALLNVAGYVVFLEETLFRIVPLLIAGIWGAIVGSVVWALLHNAKLYNANTHLKYSTLRNVILAHSIMFMMIATFYVYALYLSPILPYLFHSLNNTIVTIQVYRSMWGYKVNNKYFEGSKSKTGKKKRKVAKPIPVAVKSIYKMKSKYIEPVNARRIGLPLRNYTVYVEED